MFRIIFICTFLLSSSVSLMSASALTVDISISGTVNSAVAGTTIVSGDPFFANFRLNSLTTPFVTGGFTQFPNVISNLSAAVDGSAPPLFGYSSTINGSADLFIGISFSKFGPPFNGTGNVGRLGFTFYNLIQNDDLGTLTLAALLAAPLGGFVDAQGVSISGLAFSNVSISAVPLPAALPLFGTGLAIMGLLGWRRKCNQA